jgi:hypothetical protein
MDWLDTLKKLAPTVATAFLGPLGGVAVAAIGNVLGVSEATQDKIAQVIQQGQLTPEQITAIKQLELQYQENEKERQFKYSELAFKDRDSARFNNTAGGTQRMLFGLSLVLLLVTLGSEVWVLFNGVPDGAPEIIIGRVLGLMDSVALMVLAYHYGSSSGSAIKSELLAAK